MSIDLSFFTGDTLDDLMRDVLRALLDSGEPITSTKGPNVELCGVLLELTSPRARLSRTETRGKPFSCLAELCWYLAGTNQVEPIAYYVPQYREYADDGIVYGGYGPRLQYWNGSHQMNKVIELLREKPSSRQAVIQLFDAADLITPHKDIPCTCSLQFLLRAERLHMITVMRSNDAFLGLPHDVFCFTMIQELMARQLSVEVGTYRHFAGSIHLYEPDFAAARVYLGEGWQSTQEMPMMPPGDPWPAVEVLLQAEKALRRNGHFDTAPHNLAPYWLDLIRLLEVFRRKKEKNPTRINLIRGEMSSPVFDVFIEQSRDAIS